MAQVLPGRPVCTMHVGFVRTLVCVLAYQLHAQRHQANTLEHKGTYGKVVRCRWVHVWACRLGVVPSAGTAHARAPAMLGHTLLCWEVREGNKAGAEVRGAKALAALVRVAFLFLSCGTKSCHIYAYPGLSTYKHVPSHMARQTIGSDCMLGSVPVLGQIHFSHGTGKDKPAGR